MQNLRIYIHDKIVQTNLTELDLKIFNRVEAIKNIALKF